MASTPRVECRFGPSRRARFWLVALHLAAAGIAICLPMPWRLGALLWVVLGAAWVWRQPAPCGLLCLEGDGSCWLDRGEGGQPIDIAPSSLVTASLIVLRYRGADGRRGVLLLWPDSAGRDALRQLRIALRWRQLLAQPQ